jgi:DNA polymerase I-like protein with 3'-5' exonuclease and polymerase domains
MTKLALVDLFQWINEHNLFGKVLLVNVTHDEINCEYPKVLEEFPSVLQTIMQKAGARICSKVNVPAEAAVGPYWIH